VIRTSSLKLGRFSQYKQPNHELSIFCTSFIPFCLSNYQWRWWFFSFYVILLYVLCIPAVLLVYKWTINIVIISVLYYLIYAQEEIEQLTDALMEQMGAKKQGLEYELHYICVVCNIYKIINNIFRRRLSLVHVLDLRHSPYCILFVKFKLVNHTMKWHTFVNDLQQSVKLHSHQLTPMSIVAIQKTLNSSPSIILNSWFWVGQS